jgi:hypothetical protein
MILSFLTSLSISPSTCELDPTTLNVNDGMWCLFSKNSVSKESETFPNIDIIIKTLVLKIKHIFYFSFKKITTFFTSKTKKFQGFNKVQQT